MTRSRPISQNERLAVVEEQLDTVKADVSEIQSKLDRLLDLAQERASAVANVQTSLASVQRSVGALRDDTKIIRDGMGFARILRRILFWGTPIVVVLMWAADRFDLIIKLFRRP